ncbi:carbonic anhydrase family protein [Candidatus Acetothermia bacterium]|nr:carbonic anhydrase family protein [Candidatus Acetothermia bacterium]
MYYIKRIITCVVCLSFAAIIGWAGSGAEWGYEGKTGPDFWGSLSPDYALCSSGKAQSPINIVDSVATKQNLRDIVFHYEPTKLHLLNNGHTLELEYEEGSSIEIDGTKYGLVQLHFHAPSEHTINGRQFDMEMHLVHKSASGNLAVIGVMIRKGKENKAYEQLWNNLPAEKDKEASLNAKVNADDLLPANRLTYRYTGSLTTPPCSEGVSWNVLTTPIEFSQGQIDRFTEVLNRSCCTFNNRPVQPLNGRELYRDTSKD